MVLPLSEIGLYHIESGVHGIDFPYGQTGLAALDDGYFYVSFNDKTDDNKQTSDVYLYKWNGTGFDRVVSAEYR
jgi:hypothetical protein